MAMPPHRARIAMCAWLVGYQSKTPGAYACSASKLIWAECHQRYH